MADRRRRQFLTLLGGGIVAAWPLTARAQQTPALIGFLVSGAAGSFAIFVEAFKQGMHDNGMMEGRDYVLDLRYADGDYSRFETLAAELVQRKPAAIVVTTISAARAAQRATSTIPVVMTGLIDPVGQGLIASLARPGGNTTGLANLAQDVCLSWSKSCAVLSQQSGTLRYCSTPPIPPIANCPKRCRRKPARSV
jgi:putative ABC transport system substrate-binding protein